MNRKLVKQGTATLMVSLPIKWVKKFNLKKGDEVGIEEQENAVVITSSRAVSIEADKLQKLISLYREGFDEIEITFKDIKVIDKTREILNELPGFDIVQQKKDSCLIKYISGKEENAMQKLHSLLADSFGELLNDFKSREKNLTHIVYADANINKQANLAMRLNRNNSKLFYEAASFGEIGDLLKELAEFATKNKLSLSDRQIRIFEKINSMLRNMRIEKLEIDADVNGCFRRIYDRLIKLAEYY